MFSDLAADWDVPSASSQLNERLFGAVKISTGSKSDNVSKKARKRRRDYQREHNIKSPKLTEVGDNQDTKIENEKVKRKRKKKKDSEKSKLKNPDLNIKEHRDIAKDIEPHLGNGRNSRAKAEDLTSVETKAVMSELSGDRPKLKKKRKKDGSAKSMQCSDTKITEVGDNADHAKTENVKRKRKKKNSNKKNKFKNPDWLKEHQVGPKENAPESSAKRDDLTSGETQETMSEQSDYRPKLKKRRKEHAENKKDDINSAKPFRASETTSLKEGAVTTSGTSKKAKKRRKKVSEIEKSVNDVSNLSANTVVRSRSKLNVVKLKKILATREDGPSKTTPSKGDDSPPEAVVSPQAKTKKGVGSLRERMEEKLSAARFRYLNEQLYTTSGEQARCLFRADPASFSVYHDGFSRQVAKWPTNPVDAIVKIIQKLPETSVVADFGCGDAKIAQSLPNKVHSFDLVAVNARVTACNMAKVPLGTSSVDVAVYCLSLMGTDLVDYLVEGNRVLKKGGLLLIAEVQSRIDDLKNFVRMVERIGFTKKSKDSGNKMFVLLTFIKVFNTDKSIVPQIELAPCLYKRR